MGITEGEIPDSRLPHQEAVDDEIDTELAGLSDEGVIANVAVLSAASTITSPSAPGSTYAQAEAASAKTAIDTLITQGANTETNVISLDAKLNLVLGVFRDAGLIPTA